MKRTTILADEELLIEAKHLAAQTGKTLTEVVQQALREYIEANRPKRRISFAGRWRSEETDVSLRDEEILRAEIDPIDGWSPKRSPSAQALETFGEDRG